MKQINGLQHLQRNVLCAKTFIRGEATTAKNTPVVGRRPIPNAAQMERLKQVGRDLIDARAQKKQQYWEKASIQQRRAWEESEIGRLSRANKVKSQERLEFEASREEQDLGDATPSLIDVEIVTRPLPGSFVELRRNAAVIHGVLINEQPVSGVVKINTLTQRGEIWTHNPNDIMFSIPDFVPTHLVEQIRIQDESPTKKDLLTRLSIMKRINAFEQDIAKMESRFAPRVSKIYAQTIGQRENEWSRISVDKIVSMDSSIGDDASRTSARVAVHKLLMADPIHFVARALHRSSLEFSARPKSEVENIHRVIQWVRKNSPELNNFLDKAKDIVAISQNLVGRGEDGPPALATVALPSFTESDQHIIRFLRCALRSHSAHQPSPYDAFAPTILKRLAIYKRDITDDVIFGFLQDIGALSPWQDRTNLTEERTIAEGGPYTVAPVDTSSLLSSDPHYDQRHDWGQLPVFVIDSADAHELDDGISVEPQPDGSAWVHVHVADPTSRLPRSHPIALTAASRGSTIYGSQETIPMLPNSYAMTEHSLGALGEGKGQSVLTFSTRVDQQGGIIDSCVRVGIVHNIHVLTYKGVEKSLGIDIPYYTSPFGNVKQEDPGRPVPQEILSELKALQKIAENQQKRRFDAGRFSWHVPKANARFPDKPIPASEQIPQLWTGFPTIEYTVEPGILSPARQLVAQAMILAGQAAGRFCAERGLPALFRTSPQPLGLQEKHLNLGPVVPMAIALKQRVAGVPAYYSVNPSAHWALGVDGEHGYVRVTSPLRRFSDMVMHWQIKSALLNPASPEISKDEMESYAARLHERERLVTALSRSQNSYWASVFIQRRLRHEPGDSVLGNQKGLISSLPELETFSREYVTGVVLPELGLKGWLYSSTKSALGLGDEVQVRVTDVTMIGKPRVRLSLLE
ncbi:SubName: Full=Uncharacterized protein {ECO:0000313/EMBL:CCA69472.1} [Serendipita indica DSM 11827]|nr:SubName: Full=Uncharacterized protein {ECO:0000313/EMBL:CCA69472.1} [Serendipita indica DSM 11827]